MNNDIERAQEIAKRVNQALEGTGRSVTVEDMIVLSDRMMASGWDISTFLLEDVLALTRDILWNHTSTPKPSSVKPAGKVQPSEITIYPNVGVNQLRLGMAHDEVEQILGKPQWVSEPFDDIPAQEDYCWNGYPNWIFRLAFREGRLSEIMICLDETREQNIPVMLWRCRTVGRSPGGNRPEAAGILRLLLQHLPPKPGDVSEISCHTP